MSNEGSRKREIKARLGSLVDPASLPADAGRQHQRTLGYAMLLMSTFLVFIAAYIPADDAFGRAGFLGAALLYVGLGAWKVIRAKRR